MNYSYDMDRIEFYKRFLSELNETNAKEKLIEFNKFPMYEFAEVLIGLVLMLKAKLPEVR